MKPGNSGIVLLYNCAGPKFFTMKQVFAMLRLRIHSVGPERYHVPLVDLALGQGEPEAEPGEAFPEPMLIFCGLNSAFLNQVLNVLRTAKLPQIPLKAVMTPTNRTWDSRQVYEELLREREAMEKKANEGGAASQETAEQPTVAQETAEQETANAGQAAAEKEVMDKTDTE